MVLQIKSKLLELGHNCLLIKGLIIVELLHYKKAYKLLSGYFTGLLHV